MTYIAVCEYTFVTGLDMFTVMLDIDMDRIGYPLSMWHSADTSSDIAYKMHEIMTMKASHMTSMMR